MEEGWGGKSSLAHFCRMNFADKTRQVSRGGGSLSRGIRRGALSRKTNAPVKMNARPCLPLPALPNDLTSSIHLQFFDGNPFPMKGRCFETVERIVITVCWRELSFFSFFFFFSRVFFFFFASFRSKSINLKSRNSSLSRIEKMILRNIFLFFF